MQGIIDMRDDNSDWKQQQDEEQQWSEQNG